MVTFADLRPLFPFIVRQEGTMVQIKPFASYYIWLDWFDLAPLDQTALIEYVGTIASEAGIAAVAAQTDATTALANAATAQAAADAAQADADAALAAAAGVAVDYPSTYFINPRSTKTISVGFGAWSVADGDVFNGLYVMTGLNAEVEVKLPLNAGNYNFLMVVTKYSAAGDVSLYLDGVLKGTFVLYSAATVRNQEISYFLAGVTKGLHTFRIKITSAHGSSSGFNLACNMMSVYEV